MQLHCQVQLRLWRDGGPVHLARAGSRLLCTDLKLISVRLLTRTCKTHTANNRPKNQAKCSMQAEIRARHPAERRAVSSCSHAPAGCVMRTGALGALVMQMPCATLCPFSAGKQDVVRLVIHAAGEGIERRACRQGEVERCPLLLTPRQHAGEGGRSDERARCGARLRDHGVAHGSRHPQRRRGDAEGNIGRVANVRHLSPRCRPPDAACSAA